MTVYGSLSCVTKEGKAGCECTFTVADNDCELLTDCIPIEDLSTYDSVLHTMFTEEEIMERANSGTRIVEPELVEALRADGFPVKEE